MQTAVPAGTAVFRGKWKRTDSRFAAFGERGGASLPFLRTEMPLRDIPVFRMAYFTIKPYYGLISKTLMLQVRSAHPPMPHRNVFSKHPSVPLGLFGKPKRSSSSRFAASIKPYYGLCSKTLDLLVRSAHPPMPHRNVFSKHPGVPHGLFSDSAPTHLRCAGVPLGLFGKPKRSSSSRFAAFIKPYYGLCSKTLDLQVRSAHPPIPHRNVFSKLSGVPLGFFGKPKRSSFSRFAAFGGRGSFAPPAPPSPAALRIRGGQLQRLPLRGAGAQRLKGGCAMAMRSSAG